MNGHPAVQMSRVGGRKNPVTGAIVVAEIVPLAPSFDKEALAREILAHCRRRLERHKTPATHPLRRKTRPERGGKADARGCARLCAMSLSRAPAEALALAVARELARGGLLRPCVARRETAELCAQADDARTQASGDIRFVSFDLEKLDEIADFVRSLRDEHGRIYGLVNNAGMSVEGILARLREKDIERVVRLNVLAPIVVAKQAVRSMMAAGEGRIVNMASIVASTGFSGLSVYAATKASMIGFTHSLAREVGALGITVNAVAPGFIETDMTASSHRGQLETIARRSALKRLAKTEDVASCCWLLAEREGAQCYRRRSDGRCGGYDLTGRMCLQFASVRVAGAKAASIV